MTVSTPLLSAESISYLEDLTKASIEASRVRPNQIVDAPELAQFDLPGNTLGYTLIRPGGRACYPAVWTQDFSMTLATGFVSIEEAIDHLRLVAQTQNGSEMRLMPSGAFVPPYAIADHILFDGTPVYFPGTYSSKDGGEPCGMQPPFNNYFDFIFIAWHVWQRTGSVEFLREAIAGIPLIDRLRAAFSVPVFDPESGLIRVSAENRAVGFLFYDAIYLTGYLFFGSLIRWRGAHHLADLERALGETTRAEALVTDVARIPIHLGKVFAEPERVGGWLLAATEVGRQPDVWGTIYALYLGVLAGEIKEKALAEIVKALDEGTIAYQGAIRHVPTNHNAFPDSAWERTPIENDRYQNGAFWHTPTGWLVAILSVSHPKWAQRIFEDMIHHLKEEDFRKGGECNAPWECIGLKPNSYCNPLFLASVSLPYGVLKDLKR